MDGGHARRSEIQQSAPATAGPLALLVFGPARKGPPTLVALVLWTRQDGRQGSRVRPGRALRSAWVAPGVPYTRDWATMSGDAGNLAVRVGRPSGRHGAVGVYQTCGETGSTTRSAERPIRERERYSVAALDCSGSSWGNPQD